MDYTKQFLTTVCLSIVVLVVAGCLIGWLLDTNSAAAEAPAQRMVHQPRRETGYDIETLDALIRSLAELEQELTRYSDLAERTSLLEGWLACIRAEAYTA